MDLKKVINWGIFFLLTIIWGSSFILMKHAKQELTASQIAALRIFSAGLVFLPFAIFHLAKVPRKKIVFIVLSGLFGNLFPAFLFATAIVKHIDSALSSILNALTPLFVIVIGITFFKAKVKTQKLIGVLIGLGGLILLFVTWKGITFDNFKYASLILVATVSYGLNVNMVSHFLKGVKPIHAATISLGFLTIPCAIILWQQGFLNLAFDEPGVQWAIADASILGIVGSAIATALFYILILRAGGLFASLVTYGIPIVGIFWGVIDGENVTLMQVGCLVIILAGVYLANRQSK